MRSEIKQGRQAPPRTLAQSEGHTQAILCGACRAELTISEYLQCNSTCPACHAHVHPACRNHSHFYFAVPPP